MPSFERSLSSRKSTSSANAYSYDKLMAMVTPRNTSVASAIDKSVFTRSHRVVVAFKDSSSYNNALASMDQGTYQNTAGCDLSTVFMPFQTKQGATSGLPGFNRPFVGKNYAKRNAHLIMPFVFESGTTTNVTDRWSAPSGDALRSVVSSERYYGDVDQFRDNNNVRSIGLRLPAMGVGWGYTIDGAAWPSGGPPAGVTVGSAGYPSGASFFKGGLLDGTQLDPSDYVAAPIDFRYDPQRDVWTAGNRGFLAQVSSPQWVKSPGGGSGLAYNWNEMDMGPSGIISQKVGGRFGRIDRVIIQNQMTLGPAFEMNGINLASTFFLNGVANATVWMEPYDKSDSYVFHAPIPRPRSRFMVLSTVDDFKAMDWDYPRFH